MVGVYIVGVTWFARTEAHVSNQKHVDRRSGPDACRAFCSGLIGAVVGAVGGLRDPYGLAVSLFAGRLRLFTLGAVSSGARSANPAPKGSPGGGQAGRARTYRL